ncbi:MAG: hypothetical protein AAF734_02070, partial [Bacteroidota bacterium]
GVLSQKEVKTYRDSFEKSNMEIFYVNQAYLLIHDVNALYGKADQNKYLSKLEERVERLEELWGASRLTTVYNQYLKAQELILQVEGRWRILLQVLDSSETLVAAKKLSTKIFDMNRIRNMKMFTLTMLKRYEEAVTYGGQQLKHFVEDEYNYYIFQLNHTLALIYAGYYQQVVKLVKKLEESRNWQVVVGDVKEQFYLMRAYARFLSGQQVNYSDLYNRMVKLRRNALGTSINLRILELLIDLKGEDYISFERKLKNLHNSLYTNTKNKQIKKPRTNRFLLLLWKVVQHKQLPVTQLREKGRHLYNRLKKRGFEGIMETEFEAVPYEQLWDFVLLTLATQKKKNKAGMQKSPRRNHPFLSL